MTKHLFCYGNKWPLSLKRGLREIQRETRKLSFVNYKVTGVGAVQVREDYFLSFTDEACDSVIFISCTWTYIRKPISKTETMAYYFDLTLQTCVLNHLSNAHRSSENVIQWYMALVILCGLLGVDISQNGDKRRLIRTHETWEECIALDTLFACYHAIAFLFWPI